MDLIPFENAWPYERMIEDIYLSECPKCGSEQVLTHMRPEELQHALEGIKTKLILPCCHNHLIIAQADEDYFWTTESLRK
ncbi:hypothetical protein [Salsuginibacillus kocurii]|uniref:hypothetical protein n=1 Tax=Salsuginibacillus kocurii TaxID=427078 RepID=UPI000379348C|nr:hypothetical protein [Salsuginibacillus kocurii]